MNREIRFNAWLPELGYMLKDVAVGHGTIGFPFIDEPEDDFYQFLKSKEFIKDDEDNLPDYIYDSGESWCSITEEKHFVLLQFTGLKDKNGIDIYEGDIVSAKSWNPHAYQVEFIEGGFCGNYKGNNMPIDINLFYDSTGCAIEVIGNIYQNSDLLNETL